MDLLYETLLDYVSIIILLIVIIYSKTQFSKDIESNRIFSFLSYSLLVFTLSDLIGVYTMEYRGQIPVWVNYTVSSIYFLADGFVIVSFYKYVEKYTNAKVTKSLAYYVLSYFPALLGVEIVIANCFVFLIFEFDRYGGAAYGPLFSILYVIVFYYYVLIIVMLFRNRKRISARQMRAVLYFIVTSMSMIAVQVLLLPELPLQIFGLSVATLIMMLRLETPDYQKLESTLKSLEAAREQADKLANLKRFFVGDEDNPSAYVEYDYKKSIDNIFRTYSKSSDERKIEMILETDESIPDLVLGDRVLMWQVVNDFLSNVIGNTRKGKVRVKSSIENLGEDSFNIVVSIISTNLELVLEKLELVSQGITLNVSKTEEGYEKLTAILPHTRVQKEKAESGFFSTEIH